MHVLSIEEVNNVSGGGDIADAAQVAAAIGGALGAAYAAGQGATGTAVAGAAGIGASYFAGVAAIGYIGWNIGSAIYEVPGVQTFIADTLDSWFAPEPTGTVTVGPLIPVSSGPTGSDVAPVWDGSNDQEIAAYYGSVNSYLNRDEWWYDSGNPLNM